MYIIFSLLKQMTIIITNRTRKYKFKLGIKCIVNVISCFFFDADYDKEIYQIQCKCRNQDG